MGVVDIFKMGLEDAKPRKQFVNDFVGSIKGGYVIGKRPIASKTVVFTSDDPEVAESVKSLYGGDIEELDVEKGDDHRLVSETVQVDLLLSNPEALESSFVLFGNAGLVFRTDGQTILEGEDHQGNKPGDPWTPPSTLKAWKDSSKKGLAPSPEIVLRGRLADGPEIGLFRYRTGSWGLVNDLPDIQRALNSAADAAEGEDIRVTLSLVPVEFTTKDGTDVSYTRPEIKVHQPVAGLKAAA